jgi:topoisomerase IV subunit B
VPFARQGIESVERLMGRDPAHRFEFIRARASAVDESAIDA